MKNTKEIKEKKITAAKMKEILENEYGIHNALEFEKAMKESPGVDIGIFTTPIKKSN